MASHAHLCHEGMDFHCVVVVLHLHPLPEAWVLLLLLRSCLLEGVWASFVGMVTSTTTAFPVAWSRRCPGAGCLERCSAPRTCPGPPWGWRTPGAGGWHCGDARVGGAGVEDMAQRLQLRPASVFLLRLSLALFEDRTDCLPLACLGRVCIHPHVVVVVLVPRTYRDLRTMDHMDRTSPLAASSFSAGVWRKR